MEQINKKIGLGMLMVFAMLVLPAIIALPGVSAATTINTPVDNGNYSGTVDVNVTTDLADTLNVTCYYEDGGEVNTSSSVLTTIVNDSVSDTEFTDTVDISSFTDSADYNVTCVADDGAAPETATAVSGITFDSTSPVVSLNVKHDGDTISTGYIVRYICSISDSVDSSVTESFDVTHPAGDDTSTTSLTSGSSDYRSFEDTDYVGDYTFTCEGTDYTGNTASSTATVSVDEQGRVIVVDEDGSDNNMLIWVIIAGIVLFAWLSKKK